MSTAASYLESEDEEVKMNCVAGVQGMDDAETYFTDEETMRDDSERYEWRMF